MKDAVLITHEDFAKVSARAIEEFIEEFVKTAGTSERSMTHMLIGLAITTKMAHLFFKEEEDEDNSDQ